LLLSGCIVAFFHRLPVWLRLKFPFIPFWPFSSEPVSSTQLGHDDNRFLPNDRLKLRHVGRLENAGAT